MALFKIFKGNNKSNLDNMPKNDGYAYYNTNNGLFYIDAYYTPTDEQIKENDPGIITDENDKNYGLILDRKSINAHSAFYDNIGNKISDTYIKDVALDTDLANTLNFVKGNGDQIQISLTPTTVGLGNAKIFYGICDSPANSKIKEVTCENFNLSTDNILYIKFNNANSANINQIQLNVAGSGNKNIVNITEDDSFIPNTLYQFIYDGTNWVLIRNQGENIEVVRLI